MRVEPTEVRVNFRWGKAQVDVIRRAAALSGVPYQSYLKVVLMRQAVRDLAEYSNNGVDLESIDTIAPGLAEKSTQ